MEEDLDFDTPFSQMNAWTIISAYFEEHGLVRQQCVARNPFAPLAWPPLANPPQPPPPTHTRT